MRQKQIVGQIAAAVLAEYPNAPTRTLASKMYNENKSVFKDFEHARTILRYHSGENGKKNRKNKIISKREKITIPNSWAEHKDVFIIPSGYKRVGIISDIQCPFHDEKAVAITLNYLRDIKIDCLLINGDFVDFYGLSNFIRDPRKRNFAEERDTCIQMLRYIRQELKCPIYYSLDANHEQRYERYMMIKAPEFFSTNLFHIEDLLMIHDIGIIPLRGYDHIKIGKLAVLHGHTIFRGAVSPVSPARTIQMKLNQSAICSHVHKKSQYTWTNLDGETHSTWTTGCLMKIGSAVDYAPHGSNYVHGFAYVEVFNDGMFAVENKMIINGKVV